MSTEKESTPKRKYTKRSVTPKVQVNKIVSADEHSKVKADRDFWKDIALKALAKLAVVFFIVYIVYQQVQQVN